MKSHARSIGVALIGLLSLVFSANVAEAKTRIEFYYPIQVGGPLTKIIDGYVARFEKENPDIEVVSVYSGNYTDTSTKALTAARSGKPPAVAVLLATDIFTFRDQELIEPLDNFIKTDEDKAWLAGFMPAFLKSAKVDGKIWAVPFQRSTAVLYWNKDAFKEAGLDPEKYPRTWDEMVAYGKAVTRKEGAGKPARWGVGIPGNVGSSQWLFGALVAQNGSKLMNDEGTQTYLTDPKVVEALQFWLDLSRKDGVHPPGIFEWGTAPADFLEGRVAMIWTTTGNLSNIRKNAKFKFGLAPYPGHPNPASVLGGGNLYLFKDAPESEKAAAFRLIKFLTSDELLSDWSIQTGYVAPRDGSWKTKALMDYTKEVPEVAVAREQIPVSVPEFSTHENARTTTILNNAIGAALTGAKTPEQALTEAQAEISRILKDYR